MLLLASITTPLALWVTILSSSFDCSLRRLKVFDTLLDLSHAAEAGAAMPGHQGFALRFLFHEDLPAFRNSETLPSNSAGGSVSMKCWFSS